MRKRLIYLFIVMTILLGTMPTVSAKETVSAWAEETVSAATDAGLVPEFMQQNYNSPITRQEFAALAIHALALAWNTQPEELLFKGQTSPFTDTKDAYVMAVYDFGVIQGRGDGTFDPKGKLTRQEAAKVLAGTFALAGGTLPAAELGYADAEAIADWAKAAAAQLNVLGIMKGVGENQFAPQESYTKEQSIATLWRMLEAYQTERKQEGTMQHQNPAITQMLTVRDGKLMAGEDEVVLRGVNLGGWLLTETWMSPILDPEEALAHTDVVEILTERFGTEQAGALVELYRDNFITEADFADIAALGFNCVRIPFWYGNFMTEDGAWLAEDAEENPGFQRLDWALEQCEKHGIYAILDMHGCPGGQSTNHTTGTIGKCELYRSEANLKTMEQLWTAIADRYKDNPVVAAYDVMNEPQNNTGYSGKGIYQAETTEAAALTNYVYARVVKAIRSADPGHVITVEGIWTVHVLPDPKQYGWENMMYQLHIYDREPKPIAKRVQELLYARDTWGVAVYAGEYNSGALEEYAAGLYEKHGISRTKWTYKTVGRTDENWGLYNKDMTKLDLTTASLTELQQAFGTAMRTENGFALNQEEYAAIQ
ncbi:MAG: cellulase family glycosylhydrolase [Clostridia bacterium]|nr:cellulase family glycosylhydrolase [Clostridia bacterium]